jgi:hypothetical protein
MLQATSNPRAQVIVTLSAFRQEWQEATKGKSLIEIDGNVGLILADLAKGFGLTAHEQTLMLGPNLFVEVRDMLSMPAHR